MNPFSLTGQRYRNSFRAKVVLRMIELENVEAVAHEFGITPHQIRKWMQVYGPQPRDILEDAARGIYDSPDHFMEEVRKNSTYNFYFFHAIQCRTSGLPVNVYAENYASIDYVDFEPFYRRIAKLSFEDLDRLLTAKNKITPVDYDKIIKNLRRVITALEKGAQAPSPEPILPEEIRHLKALRKRLDQTIRLIDATNKNRSDK